MYLKITIELIHPIPPSVCSKSLTKKALITEFYEASAFTYLQSHGLADIKVLRRIKKGQEPFMLPKAS